MLWSFGAGAAAGCRLHVWSLGAGAAAGGCCCIATARFGCCVLVPMLHVSGDDKRLCICQKQRFRCSLRSILTKTRKLQEHARTQPAWKSSAQLLGHPILNARFKQIGHDRMGAMHPSWTGRVGSQCTRDKQRQLWNSNR